MNKTKTTDYKLLLHGIDTVECAYYLKPFRDDGINFADLTRQKERSRQSKKKEPVPVKIGNCEFFLQPYGTSSGYPLVINNGDFNIQFGLYNKPNFFVKFYSQALWRESAFLLQEKFLKWASSAGFKPYKNEGLSRVDFNFDYNLPEIDFDEDSFISRSDKDNKFRENKKAQTFGFGKGDIVLRVYNKVAEIRQKSDKVWFFILWGQKENVWRIEWQVRKPILRQFKIETFDDLKSKQGDLLRYLSEEHDVLKIPNEDSNPSRLSIHPLWADLQRNIQKLNYLGVSRVYGQNSALEERMMRMGVSVYGYLKRLAALHCFQNGKKSIKVEDAVRCLNELIFKVDEQVTWNMDVQKRIKEIELGKW